MSKTVLRILLMASFFFFVAPQATFAQGMIQKLYQTWTYDLEKSKAFLKKEGVDEEKIKGIEARDLTVIFKEQEMIIESNVFNANQKLSAAVKILKFDEDKKTIDLELQPDTDGPKKSVIIVQFLSDDLVVIRSERDPAMLFRRVKTEDKEKK